METPEVRLRISVLGLFVDLEEVLLLHQITEPDADRWDLPGGGLEPEETLLDGLSREVREETGMTEFRVDGLLTVSEGFYPRKRGGILHTVHIVYKCSVPQRPTVLFSDEPEVGPKGIQWLPLDSLSPEICTTRTWKALQAANLVMGEG
jgi:ADP-ribose pyrophosphatase YjhB (NUDIX family)